MTPRYAETFSDLAEFKQLLNSLRNSHATTLKFYWSDDNKGFFHQTLKRAEASRSSSATCISSLLAADLWGSPIPDEKTSWKFSDHTEAVAEKLLETPWTSAGLDDDNPFTLAFIAQGILDLYAADPSYPSGDAHKEIVKSKILPLLESAIESGSVEISPYPPSAYLTWIVYRVVRAQSQSVDVIQPRVNNWSRSEINKQLALIGAKSRNADAMQLAYAIILAATTAAADEVRPEDQGILDYALGVFFGCQNSTGTWPLSQPLFHYPKVGNAYCFEFELLTHLVSCKPLVNELIKYLPQLSIVTEALPRTGFELDGDNPGKVLAWPSGHHPQIPGPESWSTAAVYEYAAALDRLIAEGIRRAVFDELDTPYTPPRLASKDPETFAPKDQFLDAIVKVDGITESLRKVIFDKLVSPVAAEASRVARGRSLSKDTHMSGILFGPPGTSKTEMAKLISRYIGWPLLEVDPSYVVSEGVDRVQSMANRLFKMLGECEQVVVLLDEFDEMGRDRSHNNELLSRFITTSMLPKLIKINEQRRIVFLLATNYVTGFDAAFSRRGRFDVMVQMMPPTTDEKLRKWPDFKIILEGLNQESLSEDALREELSALTFAEAKTLAKRLVHITDPAAARKLLKEAFEKGTLQQPHDPDPGNGGEGPTWFQTSTDEAKYNRLG